MKKLALVFWLFLLAASVMAPVVAQQKSSTYKVKHLPTPAPRFFSPAELVTTQVAGTFGLTSFLTKQFPVEKYGELRQVSAVKSPVGTHYLFRQFYQNRPLYKTELKLNVSPDGEILSAAASLHELPKKKHIRFIKKKQKIANLYLQKRLGEKLKQATYTLEETLFLAEGTLTSGILVTYGSPSTIVGAKEILLDAKGLLRDEYDLITNYKDNKGKHTHAAAPAPQPVLTSRIVRDTAITALVLKPAVKAVAKSAASNPITHPTTSMALQGPNQQRVNFLAGIRNDTFLLQSPYAIIKEFDLPARPVVYSLTPSFQYRLGQEGFEQVNVLYHITAWQQYLHKLGFTNLANFQLEVDANGWHGLDQSSYSAFTNTLSFGVGGIEDGQDPQVIIHEYSHAIARSACATPAIGYERKLLEEGNADYFAVSYKRATDSTDWHRIFTHDGHNEFWPGRMAVTEKRYPGGMQGDIYADAVIWTATLMQIQEQLGREVTDRLVMQSVYSYSSYLTLPEAARLLLQTDWLLYNGAHCQAIASTFISRGILPKTTDILSYIRVAAPARQQTNSYAYSETATASPTPALPASAATLPIQASPTPNFSVPDLAAATPEKDQTLHRSALTFSRILNSLAMRGGIYFMHTTLPEHTHTTRITYW